MTGVIFDIKEFAINDGPGIRLTVFMKGCPLRCKWCHNPEGLSENPQRNVITGRIVGEIWTVEQLVEHCMQFKECFDISGGGVTFSGGEATAQDAFVVDVAKILRKSSVHVNLDTSGYCTKGVFLEILQNVDMVYYDLKCMNSMLHRQMTGVDNNVILENLKALASSSVPYHIRVPLVPGVSDTKENIKATKDFVKELPHPPLAIDWLPFNVLAGGKYPTYGMRYEFDEKRGRTC